MAARWKHLDTTFIFDIIVYRDKGNELTESQVLAHLLQHRKTTAPELVRRFDDNILSAHQALLRLGRKGLVKKEKTGNKVTFELTEKAKALSRETKERDENLPFVLLLGLASSILLRASSKKGYEE